MKYKDDSLMVEHLSNFQNMVNKLIAIDIVLDNELLVCYCLTHYCTVERD